MIRELFTSQVFLTVLVTMVVCEIWKFIDACARSRKLDLTGFFTTGGMPSSHATFACSIATAIGLVDGWSSSVFLLSVGFALIVVRDAFGVRRDVDNLADTVNKIIKSKKIGISQIMKITGHTPVQVAVGVIFGIALPVALDLFYF